MTEFIKSIFGDNYFSVVSAELVVVSLWWLIPAGMYSMVIFMAGAGVRSQTFWDNRGNSYQFLYTTGETYPEIFEEGFEALPAILIGFLGVKIYIFDGIGDFIYRFLGSFLAFGNLNWVLTWIVGTILIYMLSSVYLCNLAYERIKYGVMIAMYFLFLNWGLIIGGLILQWLFEK
jgi:hypothetical protein